MIQIGATMVQAGRLYQITQKGLHFGKKKT